ncbi:hypothetical protein [Bifidobacterium oedipodis]|uniref:Uncharacterized protein n=1 Tax=Bifidobacterium oedipodis TaxID=2675322 RepID=A0A7Y0HT94_9BIFI|nr:hypothetical protein [Bifidobacterium sp. DSM 109957]NMM94846.1 hypothetical protein [Bifidobacterium sp. DSM 109957]
MTNNNENYDFFGGAEYQDSPQRHTGRRSGGRIGSFRTPRLKTSSPASRLLRKLALLTGCMAVLVSAASAVHEVAPFAISFLVSVPGRYIALAGAILIAITMILVIAARASMPRYATHGGVGAGGIVALVAAIVLLTVGVAVGVLFPEGLVQRQERDVAPVDNTAQMEQGIEQVAGTCESGWQGMNSGGLPGIITVQVCEDRRVAFVSFDSEASATIGRIPVQSGISTLLAQNAGNEQAQGDWRLLSGERWTVFGEAPTISALQQQWGGSISTVDAGDAGDTGDSAGSDSSATAQ